MLLSYFVGQRHYPINYPVKDMAVYVVVAVVLCLVMRRANASLPMLGALAVNTVLLLAFAAMIVRRDFPLRNLPVIGKHFR